MRWSTNPPRDPSSTRPVWFYIQHQTRSRLLTPPSLPTRLSWTQIQTYRTSSSSSLQPPYSSAPSFFRHLSPIINKASVTASSSYTPVSLRESSDPTPTPLTQPSWNQIKQYISGFCNGLECEKHGDVLCVWMFVYTWVCVCVCGWLYVFKHQFETNQTWRTSSEDLTSSCLVTLSQTNPNCFFFLCVMAPPPFCASTVDTEF